MQAPIRRIWGFSKLKISYLGVSLFIYLTSLLFWEIFIGPYILRHADDVRMIILVDLYQSFPSSRYICFHAVNWVWRALRKIVRKRTTFLEKNNTINKTISALKKNPHTINNDKEEKLHRLWRNLKCQNNIYHDSI